jgi:hypothetical protein
MPDLKEPDEASLNRMHEKVAELARRVFSADAAMELRVMAEE